MKGFFITLEGPDGSGKTTQIKLITNFFQKRGMDFILTREPGGTPIGEEIRRLLLDKNNSDMEPEVEALLYAASRAQHVKQVIIPALKNGLVVICDRFLDSSIVYQGISRGLGIKTIEKINELAVFGLKPDLTFVLDISPEIGIMRKKMNKSIDRIETEDLEFHRMVQNGYLMLAEREPDRIKVINAENSIEEVYKEIEAHLITLVDNMQK
ncbi:MAG: dTMP kinase [Thermosediminibacterales bacterium]|nr:dTMP kinase [Thermosediminibacterales bacterium]MDK2836320.1 dTMP kinase [Thermosediminibacterales bacterium]